MGKSRKERYIPFGHRVAKALLKYEMAHHLTPIGTDWFWLTVDCAPLGESGREKLVCRVQ